MFLAKHARLGLVFLLAVGAGASDPELRARTSFEGDWQVAEKGTTGVSGMQLAVVSESTAIIYDKVEHNPLQILGHVAWAVELDLNTQQVRPLNSLTNSWCATGSFLGNGTFVNSGGNPVVISGGDGLQGIRMFTPCDDGKCDLFEMPDRVRLASKRWYPSSVRIEDGSIIIFGGSVSGGFANAKGKPSQSPLPPNLNLLRCKQPDIRILPAEEHQRSVFRLHLRRADRLTRPAGNNGVPIHSPFLEDTLNANHFPNMVYLPDGTIFISANQGAMILDWQKNTERRLPDIPNGVRISSPFSAGHVVLPLSPKNDYRAEILICGGSTADDTVDSKTLSAQLPASDQCIRMALDDDGIKDGWQVEKMPKGRIMVDMVLMPDGRVMLVNGAETGMAGYGNVGDQIGQSNADNPALKPVIYDPEAESGKRFSDAGLVASQIPRLYHSTASLTPNGTIMLAGSNPNDDVSTNKYPTEYRLEFFYPPYMNAPPPTYTGLPKTIDYESSFDLAIELPDGVDDVTVSLMDLGFATHAVHMDQRLVYLDCKLSDDKKTLSVTAPPSPQVYPPGPAFLYVVTDKGVPSFGHKTLVGTGDGPKVDEDALANMMKETKGPGQ
ncbi:Copper radical oxidase [Mycena kentingensis (nom. inval.)]|nr:Copper radical oxidase [Mycena kentingensis (nom. inval.)]